MGVQHGNVGSIPERQYLQAQQDEYVFRFYSDPDGQLHITNRHGAAIDDAIDTFLAGQHWEDAQHGRMVSETATHVLLWAWYANRPENREVVVISCWRKEDPNA